MIFFTTLLTLVTNGDIKLFIKSAKPVVGFLGPPKIILKLKSEGLGSYKISPVTSSNLSLISLDL